MTKWASWDAIQSILAFLALFVGGYGGARAAGVVRIRMDERRTILDELITLDVRRNLDDQLLRSEDVIRSAQVQIKKWAEELPGGVAEFRPEEIPSDSIYETRRRLRRRTRLLLSFQTRVGLLTWSERASFRRYEATFTNRDLENANALADVADLFNDEKNVAENWPELLDAVRAAAAAASDFSHDVHRDERRQEFVDHVHRRLRPGWWRRFPDALHLFSLIRSEMEQIGRSWWRRSP